MDAHAQKRHRRFKPDALARLETLAQGTPEELVLQFLNTRGMNPADEKEISKATSLKPEILRTLFGSLVSAGAIVVLSSQSSPSFLSTSGWRAVTEKMKQSLMDFHRAFPLRAGLPREELKSKLGLAPRVFDAVIDRANAEKTIAANPGTPLVRMPDFSIVFKPELQKKIDALLAQFDKSPYAPPSAQEAVEAIGSETLGALIAQEKLVRLSESVLLSPQVFGAMRDWVIATIKGKGKVTAADVRDHFNTSRKYAIALLEYLDTNRVTQRVGDARVIR